MSNRIDRIKKRLSLATPGKWTTNDYGLDKQVKPFGLVDLYWVFTDEPDVPPGVYGDKDGRIIANKGNSTFISHAKEDIEFLLNRVEELESALDGAAEAEDTE
jgi:hypothetical protein